MFALVRFLLIGAFSFSAICLFTYQGIEIFHSIRTFFK